MKKWLLLGLVLMLAVSVVGIVGCGGKLGLSGKYIHEDDPGSYLELKADGTFYVYYDPGLDFGTRTGFRVGLSGTYKVEGDTIILSSQSSGAAKLWISGNVLRDEQDKRWVKEGKSAKEETLVPAKSTTPAPTTKKASTDDIEWLARLITAEAGSIGKNECTKEERIAVGWVVLNRLENGYWGNTVQEVVLAKNQFALWRYRAEGNPYPTPTNSIRNLAKELLEGKHPDPTNGAMYFFSPVSMPWEGEEDQYIPRLRAHFDNFDIDTDGVPREVPGIAKKVYFPSWTKTYTWVGDLKNIRRAYFMFYQPTTITVEQVVIFPDHNLEAAIREAVSKPIGTIHASELEGLTSLDAFKRNITDLTGLEYCTNLTGLNLQNNQISNISPLASLTNLTALNLGENQISNIKPLASLTNLTWLFLAGNQISDISPLASLTKLAWLALRLNQIRDISPLVTLHNLTMLSLEANPLSTESVNVYIPQLKKRGVDVYW